MKREQSEKKMIDTEAKQSTQIDMQVQVEPSLIEVITSVSPHQKNKLRPYGLIHNASTGALPQLRSSIESG